MWWSGVWMLKPQHFVFACTGRSTTALSQWRRRDLWRWWMQTQSVSSASEVLGGRSANGLMCKSALLIHVCRIFVQHHTLCSQPTCRIPGYWRLQ